MSVLLGFVVALAYGSGDFFGGRAAREADTAAVLLVGQVVAVAGALPIALAVNADVAAADLWYGGLAGVATAGGLGLLYHGIAHARVSVVAPITAVVGALVPVAWALANGERPSVFVLVGAACAVLAGGLIAREPEASIENPEQSAVGSVPLGVAAGGLLGGSLVLFAETSDGSGFWPVFAARAVSIVVVAVVVGLFVVRTSVRFPRGHARNLSLAAGALDIVATALLLVAVRRGLLVVVSPIVALAPAFTVAWAWLVFREPIARLQAAGLGLGLAGLVLVAAG